MKNISRRVFIKGMAVAAVATATSAVLAGCNTNMIPGTDNEGDADVVPTPSNTYTFKDGDNTLTVETDGFVTSSYNATTANAENVVLLMNLTNNLGDDLLYGVGKADTVQKGYALVLTAQVWNEKGELSAVTFDNTIITTAAQSGLTDLAKPTSGVGTLSKNNDVKGALGIKNQADNWTKIVVTAELYKAVADGQDSSNSYYYGSALDKTTFTYTNK